MSRVLIVDDDPISLRFLSAALTGMGACAVAVSDAASALRNARTERFDLLLIDRRLPDADGSRLLADLRAHGQSAAAIATSAEIDAAMSRALLVDGFAAVLGKPATLEQIRTLVAPYLASAVPRHPLDDAAALAASGDAQTLRALRAMLVRELDELEVELSRGTSPIPASALNARLHRLRAACGFCGAPALAAAASRLQTCLEADQPPQLDEFLAACRATMRALRA